MKHIFFSPWTALLTLALILSIRVADPQFTQAVRLKSFDQLITSRPVTVPAEIVTVNIDESALAKWGQWPFPRDVYGRIVEDLYGRGAGLVVLNVLMPEEDRSGRDSALANILRQYPVVLPSVPGDTTKNSPRNPGTVVLNSEYSDQIVQYPGLIANIPSLEKVAAGVGTTNTLPETADGVNRRIPLIVTVDGKIYPGLPLEALRVATGETTVQIKLAPGGVAALRIPGSSPITTDNLGRIWIDWSVRPTSLSVTELPQNLDGAIVIVGPTASGIANPVPTSTGAVFPHVVQATVLATLISGTTIQRPDWADGAELLLISLCGILLLLLARWTYLGLVTLVVLGAGVVVASWWAYSHYLFLLDPTAPLVGVVMVALHAYGIKFVSEYRQKQMIKKQFGSYVSPVIVERLQKNPELIKLGGENKQLSIVMTDMRNFTALGDSYGDRVQEFTATMNAYMTAISRPIFKNDGCLIKFIGDASLHVHGAPIDDHDHAVNAVKTGLEMIEAVKHFNSELEASGKPPVGMGVGIYTGETLIGNIGSEEKFGYDVLGDTVSMASRLEGQSKPYGQKIIIGPRTAALVKDKFFVVELDRIAVKGKTTGVEIFTVLDPNTIVPEYHNHLDNHNMMIQCYREQKWDKAAALCTDLIGCFDGQMDAYYEMWLERIDSMRQTLLPSDWDGVYVSKTK